MTDLAAEVLAGRPAAGARLIRWLEDGDARGRALLPRIHAAAGRAHVVGVTGPPGAGKSTLVDLLVAEERSRGRRVGVLAVDPTSPFTGGAILGDRLRMSRHALDAGVFIRSMGSRGAHGGLSRSTYDACLVLDAMGHEVIFVETVGVGQEEMDVVGLAHTTVILAVPGLGDEVQALKAGLLEAGEVIVINKADRDGFEQTRRHLELLLHLREGARPEGHWRTPLLVATASRGEGAAAIVDALDAHRAHLEAGGGFAAAATRRDERQFLSLARAALTDALLRGRGGALLAQVRDRSLDPYTAATRLAALLGGADPGVT
ncbi:MAG: methylmalonyl Co-A mutase-associated GTPase MeaB [Proteobacteria bacterium]|nr:methylmalonyl Co-A mutase-associated GTPase MeaB [Pseudomonadota bacterium]